jgi:hypothetical protein
MPIPVSEELTSERAVPCPACEGGTLTIVVRVYPDYDNAIAVQVVGADCECFPDVAGNDDPRLAEIRDVVLAEARKAHPRGGRA